MTRVKKHQIVEESTSRFFTDEMKKLVTKLQNHVLLQSSSCHLVSEEVTLTGSLDPDPEATSYRSHSELVFYQLIIRAVSNNHMGVVSFGKSMVDKNKKKIF